MKWVTMVILIMAVAALTGLIVIGTSEINHRDGHLTRESELPDQDESMTDAPSTFTLSSTAFEAGAPIPARYTCDGENVNPPLSITGVPEGTESLVLIMEDPDIPDFVKEQKGIDIFDHWVVFNIPTSTTEVSEGREPDGVLGRNSAGSLGYTGPCPPDAEHRYITTLYALDIMLDLSEGALKDEVREAMDGHVIAETQLVGRYERQ